MKPFTLTLVSLSLGLPAAGTLACATCGCSLSSDAAMGYSATAGWGVSLEYDYLDQDQLRNGTHVVLAAQVAALNPNAGQEVERRTTNRYLTLGVAYAPSADWTFRLAVPTIDRSHSTYASATNPLTDDQISSARVSGLGDLKLIGSYQGLLPRHNFGVQLGLKLPTGDYGGPDAAGTGVVGHHPAAFGDTGNAAGELLDTSLQAGTGSTDLILGSYYYQAVSQNFDAFVNAQFQATVAHKLNRPGADYRPGNQSSMSFGLRYEADPGLVPQMQVNLSHKSADEGALADPADTAGTMVYLSPGVTIRLRSQTHVFAFVQLPVYSRLEGYQLFPRRTFSIGLSQAF